MCMSVFNKQIIGFLRTGRLLSFVLSLSTLHLLADGKQAKGAPEKRERQQSSTCSTEGQGSKRTLFHFLGDWRANLWYKSCDGSVYTNIRGMAWKTAALESQGKWAKFRQQALETLDGSTHTSEFIELYTKICAFLLSVLLYKNKRQKNPKQIIGLAQIRGDQNPEAGKQCSYKIRRVPGGGNEVSHKRLQAMRTTIYGIHFLVSWYSSL